MLIFYFDEVKKKNSYWLGGICVLMHIVPKLEKLMNDLAQEYFGTQLLSKKTKFRASSIAYGSEIYSEWEIIKRCNLLKKLAKIVDQQKLLKRVYVRVFPNHLAKNTIPTHELAFMLFLEQADAICEELNTVGIVIGDTENPQIVSKYVENLSHYRRYRTEFGVSRKICNIVDTAHFARSHHSRMLQIADCYLWFCQFMQQLPPEDEEKRKLMTYLRDNTNVTMSDKRMVWPEQAEWHMSDGGIWRR